MTPIPKNPPKPKEPQRPLPKPRPAPPRPVQPRPVQPTPPTPPRPVQPRPVQPTPPTRPTPTIMGGSADKMGPFTKTINGTGQVQYMPQMKKGGSVAKASNRGNGIAQRGKTKGRQI